jgi:hypothetical protein
MCEWMNNEFVWNASPHWRAGLPDGFFQTKNTNLGKFWRVLQWKMLVYFMAIWSHVESISNKLWLFGIFSPIWSIFRIFGQFSLRPFGILNFILLNFVVIWYIVPVLVYFTKKNLATLQARVVVKIYDSILCCKTNHHWNWKQTFCLGRDIF